MTWYENISEDMNNCWPFNCKKKTAMNLGICMIIDFACEEQMQCFNGIGVNKEKKEG